MITKNKKILIVEDDPDFLLILKMSFENQPFKVFFADDGQKGLELAEKEKPDLMLVDIILPRMDGITMAQEIKKKGLNPKMIFLTNLNDIERINRAMETIGGAEYLVKANVRIGAIVDKVKNLV